LLFLDAMKHFLFPSVALLTACVAAPPEDPSSADPAATAITARGDRPRALTPIAIQTDLTPHLVLYREGADGPWLPAQQLKATTYEAMVEGPYTVLVLCPLEVGAFASLTSKTLQDELLVEVFCTFENYPVVATGLMAQPGMVNLGNTAFSSSPFPSWSFTLPTYPGVHDLVAASEDRVLIRRDLTITADTLLAPVDLSRSGVALVSTPIIITNPYAGESPSTNVYLRTPNARESFVYRGELPAKLAPASALGPRDLQSISVRSTSGDGTYFTFRSARRPITGELSAFTLWDPMVGLETGQGPSGDVQASWSSVAAHDWISFLAYDFSGHSIEHSVTASYLAASGDQEVVLSTDAPGFTDEWRLDPTTLNTSIFLNDDGPTRQGFLHDEYASFGPIGEADVKALELAKARSHRRLAGH
jgi:hypothetical protein